MSNAQDRNLVGSDIKLANYDLGADLYISNGGDIGKVSEEMNLAQAILHRLRTVKGELAQLGHPEYGSNIFDFLGQPNNWTTRSRLRLAIRDTIRQERRVKEIVSISVNPRLQSLDLQKSELSAATKRGGTILATASLSGDGKDDEGFDNAGAQSSSNKQVFPDSTDLLNSVDVEIVIVPQGAAKPVQITFPFNLEVS